MWKKQTKFKTLEERQKSIPGALYNLDHYTTLQNEELPSIEGLNEMGKTLINNIVNRHIVLFGDYDCDGIFSTVIVWKTLDFLAKKAELVSGKPASSIEVRIPDRINEGYGFSNEAAEEIQNSVILLLDNGIVQYEAIHKAKENGNIVLVLDHHQPGETLPEADIIVNPHAVSGGEFNEYCAAGLSYRLARYLLEKNASWAGKDEELLHEALFLSAVATIADVVPMLNENRMIVRYGLMDVPQRLKKLIKAIAGEKKELLLVDDVSFSIAPAINAVGRMGKLNTEFVKKIAFEQDLFEVSQELVTTNTMRQEETKNGKKAIEIPKDCPDKIMVHQGNFHQGIIGLLASYVVTATGKPSFVFGNDMKGFVTGSARSPRGTQNLKELLDKVQDKHPGLLAKYGGHAAAAGVTIKTESLQEFKDAVNSLAEYEVSNDKIYDFDIKTSDDWKSIWKAVMEYAPYGEGNPAPVLCLDTTEKLDMAKTGRRMFKTLPDLKTIIAFSSAFSAYTGQKPDECERMKYYGYLLMNNYGGGESYQFRVEDVEGEKKAKSPLQLALEEKMKKEAAS